MSAAARHFIDRYFPGDYKVIPNGVDVLRFERAVPIARWQDGTPNLLFVGRFEPRKGLLDLLKAFRTVRRSGLDCRLLIVGLGPQEREARRYVATRRLGDVEFLGRVGDDEKAQLFKTADAYVSPATGRESFGIVLLEAMASGTADRLLRHPWLQGRRPPRRTGPPRAAPRSGGAGRGALPTPCRRRAAGVDGRVGSDPSSRVQLGARHRQGRRLLRLRHPATRRAGPLPAHFTAAVPPSPRIGTPSESSAGGGSLLEVSRAAVDPGR